MKNILNILAALLIIGWIVGFFLYSEGGIIHILLVIAVIALLLQVLRRKQ
ncbi:MAG: lmo0937 family membrane protein [Balneolaceae bacterium]|nr:lmo0937 family membrane protein [Balneolaceae bacterium]